MKSFTALSGSSIFIHAPNLLFQEGVVPFYHLEMGIARRDFTEEMMFKLNIQ